MATIANLNVKLNLDDNGFQRGLQSSRDKLDSWGENLRSTGTKMTAAISMPIIGTGLLFTKWASDLEQTHGATEQLWGENADSIFEWAKSADRSMGMTENSALQNANRFNAMFGQMDVGNDTIMDMSKKFTVLSADLSAMWGGSPDEAADRLTSALRGNYEGLDQYNINLTEAMVNTEAMKIAVADGRDEITEADKVQARYNLIMEQSGDAQGQFARETDTTAGKLAVATARAKNAATTFGRLLLPFVNKLLDAFSSMVDWVENLSDKQRMWVIGIAAVAAAMGPLLIVIGMLLPGLSALLAVIGFIASPIGLLVVAVGALAYIFRDELMAVIRAVVDTFTDLKDKFEEFRAMGITPVQAALAALQAVFPKLGSTIAPLRQMVENLTDAFNSFKNGNYADAFSSLWAAVRNIGASLKNAFLAAVDVLKDAPSWIVEKLGDAASAIQGWFSDQVAGVEWSSVATGAMDYLHGAISSAWSTIAPIVSMIQSWFRSQFEGVDFVSVAMSGAERLGTAIGEAVANMVGIAADFLNWITNQVNSVDWNGVGTTIGNLLGTAIKAAIGAIVLASTVLAHFLKEMAAVDWASVAQSIWEFVKAAAIASIDFLAGMGKALYDQFIGEINALDWLTSLQQKGRDIINGFYEAVTTRWVAVRTWFINMPSMIFNAIGSVIATLKQKGTDILTGFFNAVVHRWGFGGVKDWFVGLGSLVLKAIGDLSGALWDAGVQLMQGFIGGVQSMAQSLINAAIKPVQDAINGVKGLLGINSPSRVFMEIGHNTMLGLANGISQWSDLPVASTENAARRVAGVDFTASASMPTLAPRNFERAANGEGQPIQYFFALRSADFQELLTKAENGDAFARGFAGELGMLEGIA